MKNNNRNRSISDVNNNNTANHLNNSPYLDQHDVVLNDAKKDMDFLFDFLPEHEKDEVSTRPVFLKYLIPSHENRTMSLTSEEPGSPTMNTRMIEIQKAGNKKTDSHQLNRQVQDLRANKIIHTLLNASNLMVIVLNKNREILFASEMFVKMILASDESALIGLRPGNAVHCIHANESDSGCGGSEACRHCSALRVILDSIYTKKIMTSEASILFQSNGIEKTLNILEHVVPADINGEECYIITMVDISDTLHKRWLEKLFFHDLLNRVGALSNYVKLLRKDTPDFLLDDMTFVENSFHDVVNDIRYQKQLMEAETGDLHAENEVLNIKDILKHVTHLFQYHDAAINKKISLFSSEQYVLVLSDKLLLTRVIENMVKNALEATPKGGEIQFGYHVNHKKVSIWVKNMSIMSEETRSRIYQRNYSTKGTGRGLGTYSMKLVGEQVLGGIISFISNEKDGTVFTYTLPIFEE